MLSASTDITRPRKKEAWMDVFYTAKRIATNRIAMIPFALNTYLTLKVSGK